MSADAEAQQIVDVASAEAAAEVHLAYWNRVRLGKKMPEPVAHDCLIRQFFPETVVWSDDD